LLLLLLLLLPLLPLLLLLLLRARRAVSRAAEGEKLSRAAEVAIARVVARAAVCDARLPRALLGSNISSSLTGASRLLHAASSLGGHLQSLTRLLQIVTSRQFGSDHGTRARTIQPVITFGRRLLYKVNEGFYFYHEIWLYDALSKALRGTREAVVCLARALSVKFFMACSLLYCPLAEGASKSLSRPSTFWCSACLTTALRAFAALGVQNPRRLRPSSVPVQC
jgi:hypothetical protein